MRKKVRKLVLGRETLRSLEDLHSAVGMAQTQAKSECVTACITNCPACQPSFVPRTCA